MVVSVYEATLTNNLEHAPCDSETTQTQHGHHREFLVDGQKVRFGEHVTIAPNRPDCLTLYFHRRENDLLIGYLGPHLPTANH